MLVNIEAERINLGMTKEELANEIGISIKTYYNWINEEVDIPSSKLQKMSRFFGVSMEYLIEKSDKNKIAAPEKECRELYKRNHENTKSAKVLLAEAEFYRKIKAQSL